MTYPVALLAVSPATHADIKAQIDKVNANGDYNRMFHDTLDNGLMIDMTHVGIVADPKLPNPVHWIENVLRFAKVHGKSAITVRVEDLEKVLADGNAEIKVGYS